MSIALANEVRRLERELVEMRSLVAALKTGLEEVQALLRSMTRESTPKGKAAA